MKLNCSSPDRDRGISVSRVGGKAQIKAMKQVSSKIKIELAQYRELASFSQFGSDVDKDTKARLDHGAILMEVLKQGQYSPLEVEDQVMIIYAAINDYLADIKVSEVKRFEKEFLAFMNSSYPQVKRAIRETGKLEKDTEEFLIDGINAFKKQFEG